MHITRFEAANTYQAPNHDDMTCYRLQGKEASPCNSMWMGMSVFEPGGQTALDDSTVEKIYFVVEGEIETLYNTKANAKYNNPTTRPVESMMWKNKF